MKKKLSFILFSVIIIILSAISLIFYKEILTLEDKINHLIKSTSLYEGEVLEKNTKIKNLEAQIKDYSKSYPAIEWLSDEEFVVYRGCGTECQVAYIFEPEKNYTRRFFYGVGYQWSPDKSYVLAYHYTLCGITVGDKLGNELFTLRRDGNKIFPKLAEKTKGAWSPDSKKLALIIKKEDKEKLELLIFDAKNNFQIIYQKDLEDINFSNFSWIDANTVSYQINGESKEVIL